MLNFREQSGREGLCCCKTSTCLFSARVCVCVCARTLERAGGFHVRVVSTSPDLLFLRVCSPLFRINGPRSPSQAHQLQSLTSLIPDPALLPVSRTVCWDCTVVLVDMKTKLLRIKRQVCIFSATCTTSSSKLRKIHVSFHDVFL
jgi:hypothetical protein